MDTNNIRVSQLKENLQHYTWGWGMIMALNYLVDRPAAWKIPVLPTLCVMLTWWVISGWVFPLLC